MNACRLPLGAGPMRTEQTSWRDGVQVEERVDEADARAEDGPCTGRIDFPRGVLNKAGQLRPSLALRLTLMSGLARDQHV